MGKKGRNKKKERKMRAWDIKSPNPIHARPVSSSAEQVPHRAVLYFLDQETPKGFSTMGASDRLFNRQRTVHQILGGGLGKFDSGFSVLKFC